jgi:hypothetical protein
MQQAVVIMADRVGISSLEVLVEGDEGQLPKLDMYNLLYANSWALHGVQPMARDLHARPWKALGEALGIKVSLLSVYLQVRGYGGACVRG